jgi:serpin B
MIKKRILITALVIVLVSLPLAFLLPPYMRSQAQTQAYAASDQKAANADPEIVKANTRFAVTMIQQLAKEDPGSNILISPLSVSTALTMAYNGAGGTTKESMARTLGVENMSLSRLDNGYLNLLQSLQSVDDTIQLSIADSMLVKDVFASKVKQSFTDNVTTYFMGEVSIRPFDSTTVTYINNWVSEKTNGVVQKMLDVIDPYDVVILLNTVYFKGAWSNMFNPSWTRPGVFKLSDGSTATVSYMNKEASYGYLNDSEAQAIRLPYGRDKVAMYVFVPRSSLDSFVDGLTQGRLDGYFTRFQQKDLELSMPRFNVTYGTRSLNDALRSLGMGVAFDWMCGLQRYRVGATESGHKSG